MAINLIDKIKPKDAAFVVIADSVNIGTDTTNFNNNLSVADNTLQKALDTLDNMAGGGVTNHAALTNLSYATAGHTGFAPALGADDNYVTDAEKTDLGIAKLPLTGGTLTGDLYNSSATVAAAGTTQGTATALTKQYNFITSGPGGVKLPTPTGGGITYFVDNDIASELSIYPNTGGKIDGGTVNVAKTLAAGKVIGFVSESTTEWLTVYGSGAYIPSGATLPTTGITDGQLFTHTPTGRSVWMKYNVSTAVWTPVLNEGTTTMYVDGASGSDNQNKGYGTGVNAFATIQFAVNQIAGLVGGNVIINVAAGTYAETLTIQGKAFTGNYRISFYGAMTITDSLIASAGTAGSGASHGTVTRNSGTWTTNARNGYLVRFTSGVNNGAIRVIDSNTTTVATIVGYWGTIANGDTFNVETWATSIKKIKCTVAQVGVDFYYIDVYGDGTGSGYFGDSFSEGKFYYCRLSGSPEIGSGYVDLNQSSGLFHVCYLYTSITDAPVIQARTLAFATVKISKIETAAGTGLGLRILDNAKAFVGLGNGQQLEPCVIEGNTAGGNTYHMGLYCYGNGIILSDYGYNKIRNFNRGAYALYGGVQYGRAYNIYTGCTTNELADAASYSFIGG
mgnify:CR=1 FL=1